ncbi:hypothetical protein Gotur_030235 [Gossypium turneri]
MKLEENLEHTNETRTEKEEIGQGSKGRIKSLSLRLYSPPTYLRCANEFQTN